MREDNVQYKMREIVKQIREALLADSGMGPTTALHAKIDQLTQAALELPLRQCDVGTAKEQAERFSSFCGSQKCDCVDCPIQWRANTNECPFVWSQMSCGEGGAS